MAREERAASAVGAAVGSASMPPPPVRQPSAEQVLSWSLCRVSGAADTACSAHTLETCTKVLLLADRHIAGRDSSSCDIYIDDAVISRKHALIQRQEFIDVDRRQRARRLRIAVKTGYTITDTSANGLYIGTRRLTKGQPHPLREGEIITFCRVNALSRHCYVIQAVSSRGSPVAAAAVQPPTAAPASDVGSAADAVLTLSHTQLPFRPRNAYVVWKHNTRVRR